MDDCLQVVGQIELYHLVFCDAGDGSYSDIVVAAFLAY